MDFYHVLPSNTSLNYFPNNTTSEYSTPLDNPYVLSSDWEVGLMSLTHSTVVNTFHNDKFIMEEKFKGKEKLSKIITLPSFAFDEESEAIRFINSRVKDRRILFGCNKKKHITLKILDESLKLTFDDTLRDIFGFDENIYSGPISFTGSGVFSLTRCIQYLYIYSNIATNIRLGNTESPLLAIVPFTNNNECALLKEKVFKTPMYIRVKQNRISQIDIAIYDGAGQLVPFVADVPTTVRLHFRQI